MGIEKLQEEHNPEVGNVYEDDRNGRLMQALHVGAEVLVLRLNEKSRKSDGHVHRLERRSSFDKNMESGRYKFKPESDLALLGEDAIVDWTEVDYVGEQGKENLYDVGYKTAADVATVDIEELTDVDAIGKVAAQNIKEYV